MELSQGTTGLGAQRSQVCSRASVSKLGDPGPVCSLVCRLPRTPLLGQFLDVSFRLQPDSGLPRSWGLCASLTPVFQARKWELPQPFILVTKVFVFSRVSCPKPIRVYTHICRHTYARSHTGAHTHGLSSTLTTAVQLRVDGASLVDRAVASVFLAVLGLSCCARAFSSCGHCSLVAALGLRPRPLLLLRFPGSRRTGVSSCGPRA